MRHNNLDEILHLSQNFPTESVKKTVEHALWFKQRSKTNEEQQQTVNHNNLCIPRIDPLNISEISKNFLVLYESQVNCDVSIKITSVDNLTEIFFAHKCIVSARSQFLCALIRNSASQNSIQHTTKMPMTAFKVTPL